MVPDPDQIGNKKLQLRASDLRGARDRDEFDLHELALEWGLSEPIVIHDESDIKAKASWKDRLEPFEHQVQNLITFCRRLPVSIIADDVGLGKTISAGLILSELIARRKVNRCLVVCTKLIAPQWIEELHNKFGIDGQWATGSAVRVLFRGDSTVVATSYDAARDYMSEARSAGFDMLILDEAHKLRNLHGTNNPPKMATVIRKTLEERIFKYVLMLTATPMQNRIWDLYSLIDCLAVAKGHENPFGNQTAFAARYGNALKYSGWSSTPAGVEFRNTLRQYLVRTRRATVKLAFPKRILELKRVPATSFDRQLIAVVANALDGSIHGKGLLSASLGVAMMSSPHALQKQLHNMAEREPGWKPVAREVDLIVERYHTPSKLEALIQICRKLSTERPLDWRVVVFTCRVETLNLIVRRLSDLEFAVGTIRGSDSARNQQAIQAFANDSPGIHVLVSTDTGAEGVNLQAGNVMVNYDLPWNPMVVEQRIGRVQRLGSKFKNVVIFNLAVKDSPEDRVVARLLHKLIEISESVGDIESILEAASEKAAGGKSLEDQIADMVKKSLMGQDVEKQRSLAEQSVFNAKRQLEENEQEMNEQLGDLSELHHAGARPPDLSQNIPSRPVREFVINGLRRLGHSITERSEYGDDVFTVRYAGDRNDLLVSLDRSTWKELKAQFPGRRVELFQPGQPSFERLLQSWREAAAAYIISLTDQTEPLAIEVLEAWLSQIRSATLGKVVITNRRPFFGGLVRCLVRASNGVDQYEKLLKTCYQESGHEELLCRTASDPNRLPHASFDLSTRTKVLNTVRSSVQLESDIARFAEFYAKRLEEELPKAGESRMRQKKLSDDFTVALEASAVSAEGFEYEACDAAASILLDGSATYQLKFSLIPATGQILDEPGIWEFCDRRNQEFPSEFMANCDYSGMRVVKHLLIKSDESERVVLDEHLDVCGRSGKRAVVDEFACSSMSGTRAVKSELHCSGISDRLYFPEEMEPCEFTSTIVGIDELKVSEISQRKFRADEAAQCCVSNLEGHRSEFATCEHSGRPVVANELGTSSVSGKRVARTLLHASERDPSRVGLPSEIVTCEASGRRVLSDEVGTCSLTGQTVDSSLLATCPETGEILLRDRMETCEVTGNSVSPRAMTTCALTAKRVLRRLCSESAVSGRLALTDACVKCEITGVVVLPGELIKSDCSSRAFRSDEAVVSELSSKTGHCSESVVCAVSGKTVLKDEVTASEFSGRLATTALLIKCAATGKLALPSELDRCEFTGKPVIPDELFVSDFSGKKCVRSERVVSELSGKQGHASEFGNCELTWKHVLLSELVECSVTGKKVLESETFRSAVLGNLAIASLGAKCEITGAVVLPTELVRSDVSGKRFRLDEAVHSEKSGRKGHQSESQVCAVSGRRLLIDELTASQVSGKLADPDSLVKCSVTGVLALPNELEKSEFSEALAVPAEIKTSDSSGKRFCSNEAFVSEASGKIGHQSEADRCAVTGKLVLKSELVRCDVTGQFVLPSECSTSTISGRLAIKSQCVSCEFSGAIILSDEVAVSSVSGKRFRKDEAVTSQKSQRIAHQSESKMCSVSKRLLLVDEGAISQQSGRFADNDLMGTCSVTAAHVLQEELRKSEFSELHAISQQMRTSDVSHRQYCVDEGVESEVSGRHGHVSEAAICEITGKHVFSDELMVCEFSGKSVLPSVCSKSIVSGRWAISSLFAKCEFTGILLLPDEIVVSSVSSLKIRKDEVVQSELSHRIGHISEGVVCDYTGRQLLVDEVGTSDYSGKTTALVDLQRSVVSQRRGTKDEFVRCAVSKRMLLKDEVAASAVSGLVVDRELLLPSDRSGQLALKNELVTCSKSGRHLLPSETGLSSVSWIRVDSDLLRKSDFSENMALPEEFLTCAVSGRKGLPSDGVKCAVSGDWIGKSFAVNCEVIHQPVRPDLCVQSAVSGRWLLQTKARRSFRSREWLHPDEAAYCHWNGGYLRTSETRICQRTGLTFDSTLIDIDGVFEKLRPLMYGEIPVENAANLIATLKETLPDVFKRLHTLCFIRRMSNSKTLFFRAHIDSRFRMECYYVTFAAKVKDSRVEIISPLTREMNDGTWKEFP